MNLMKNQKKQKKQIILKKEIKLLDVNFDSLKKINKDFTLKNGDEIPWFESNKLYCDEA